MPSSKNIINNSNDFNNIINVYLDATVNVDYTNNTINRNNIIRKLGYNLVTI
jgi:hypothetical protein